MICGQLDRLKPKLARPALPTHVNMNRLVAIETIKEEPVRSRDMRIEGVSVN